MEIEQVVRSAKTVEEAIEMALKELDADREEAEIEILSQGKPGFLGIGSEPARVRVKKFPPSEHAAAIAMDVVNKLLSNAGVRTLTTLRVARDPDTDGPVIDITGDDSGLLIGRQGETLRAMQFLVNILVRQQMKQDSVRVVLDIERYRERRHNSLKELALRVADRVSTSGKAIPLEPMQPAERRVIHIALADHPRVTTESIGAGDGRRVTITPKQS